MDKIHFIVESPIEIDMSKFTEEKSLCLYKLYAVVNHHGGSTSGHYTATCQDLTDSNEWYHFNDSKTNAVPVDESTKTPYILFYKRKEDDQNFNHVEMEKSARLHPSTTNFNTEKMDLSGEGHVSKTISLDTDEQVTIEDLGTDRELQSIHKNMVNDDDKTGEEKELSKSKRIGNKSEKALEMEETEALIAKSRKHKKNVKGFTQDSTRQTDATKKRPEHLSKSTRKLGPLATN